MKRGNAIISVLLLTLANADGAAVNFDKKFSANTKAGQLLLSRATVLEPSKHHKRVLRGELNERKVQENNYWQYYQQNNNNNNDNEEALENIGKLYIQYKGCSSFMMPDMNGNGNNNNENNQNNQNNNNNQNYQNNQVDDGMMKSDLVLFSLCRTDGCYDCSGEYATDMREFLNAYTEMQMEDQEYQCEYVRERCYCNYNNGNNYNYYDYQNSYQACLTQCFSNAGLDGCMDDYYGNEKFQLQEYLECRVAFENEGQGGEENGDDNNNDDEVQNLYVGPYCSYNQYIYLGAFYDEECTYQAYPNEIDNYNYGDGFPYFFDPILQGNECASCLQQDREEQQEEEQNYNANGYQYNQYQNNQYQNNQQQQYNNGQNQEEQNYEANELCQLSTEEAIKCDYSRGLYSGCGFLQYTLPCLDGRTCTMSDDDTSSEDTDNSYRGRYDFPTPKTTHKSMAQRYYEMKQRVYRNKRIAIAMGAIAGFFMIALLVQCFWSFACRPCSPEEQKRREPLLEKRPQPRSRSPSRKPKKDNGSKSSKGRRGGNKSTSNILL